MHDQHILREVDAGGGREKFELHDARDPTRREIEEPVGVVHDQVIPERVRADHLDDEQKQERSRDDRHHLVKAQSPRNFGNV